MIGSARRARAEPANVDSIARFENECRWLGSRGPGWPNGASSQFGSSDASADDEQQTRGPPHPDATDSETSEILLMS
jgi:hypothetical protein